jgi:hypothetical protein
MPASLTTEMETHEGTPFQNLLSRFDLNTCFVCRQPQIITTAEMTANLAISYSS